jgi:hypothetical protein
MLGIVFTEYTRFVQHTYNDEMLDNVLAKVNTQTAGAYTNTGYYSDQEMKALLQALSDLTETDLHDIVMSFGQHLFAALASSHGTMMSKVPTLFDLLGLLNNNVHKKVLSLYPKAQVPQFDCVSRTESTFTMVYRSPRGFFVLAKGLILGAAKFYRCDVVVDTEVLDAYSAILTVKLV